MADPAGAVEPKRQPHGRLIPKALEGDGKMSIAASTDRRELSVCNCDSRNIAALSWAADLRPSLKVPYYSRAGGVPRCRDRACPIRCFYLPAENGCLLSDPDRPPRAEAVTDPSGTPAPAVFRSGSESGPLNETAAPGGHDFGYGD